MSRVAPDSDGLILAVDFGTQSVRALAFDRQGALRAKRQIGLTGYTYPQPGWMEHDVEGLWAAFCAACRGLLESGQVLPAQISGIVVTTQRATVISLGADGRPLRPAIIWPDQRRVRFAVKFPLKWRVAFRALRTGRLVRGFASRAEANWIAEHQPEIHARTDKFLLLSGFLHYRLTGRAVDAVANQVGYLPFDARTSDWAAPGDWRWSCVALSRRQLPDLVPSGTLIGGITVEAARETGLVEGLPVVAGASDKACEVIGSGDNAPGHASISCGTTATINVTPEQCPEPTPFVPMYPAAIPGQFNFEMQVPRGFSLVTWFIEQFGQIERDKAASERRSVESCLDDLLAATPPGADGLLLHPHWTPGTENMGSGARGSIIGLTERHTRAHLYRAVIEGLALALRECRDRIDSRSKLKISTLNVSGGGSQSDAVMQIIADVMNLPVHRPAQFEASGLGAAVIGAVGLGKHADFATAQAAMVHPGDHFIPDSAAAALYEKIYRGVYEALHGRRLPRFRAVIRKRKT